MPTKKMSAPATQKKVVRKVRKKKKSQAARFFLMGLGVAAIAILSATAGALLAVSMSHTPLKQAQLTPEEEAVFSQEETVSKNTLQIPELTRPVNILVLGTKVLTSEADNPPEEDLGYHALVNSFKGLSDTMLLLRFSPEEDKFSVLSIPRDTQAYVKGELTKINEANYYGGPALAAESISQLLGGVTIDRYIRVNIQAIEKFIDALGGVNVYVPKDMKYTDHSQHLYINLKQGEQHLDGEKAIQFLRFRYDKYGDIGRVQRQQTLIRSVVEQALQPKTLLRIPEIVSIIQSHIDTNLTVDELLALSAFAAQTKRSNVQMMMLPGYFSGDGKEEVSYWLPNHRRIQDMMALHFGVGEQDTISVSADPTSVRIAIQDSTKDTEAVADFIDYLQKAGYHRIFVSQDEWNEPLNVTRIVAQQGDDSSAAIMRSYLGFGEVLVESTGVLASDITIQLGEDWQEKRQKPLSGQIISDDPRILPL